MNKAERDVRRMEGIINSMTPQERTHPDLIKAKRKQRIAKGAGVQVQEVNRMLKQFEQMQGMMKQLKKGGMQKMMRGMGRLMVAACRACAEFGSCLVPACFLSPVFKPPPPASSAPLRCLARARPPVRNAL